MPWKETKAMDLRTEFATRALSGEVSFTALCNEYGISTKTGYKWKQRFVENGSNGMHDVSRKPLLSPSAFSGDVVCDLCALKNLHSDWGPEKVLDRYLKADKSRLPLSLSSVKRILARAGLVQHRRKKRSSDYCGRIAMPIVATEPNQVWTVDFKGHWYTTCGSRVLPLTVCDSFTKDVLMAQIVADARTETIKECFHRLFTEYGLPEIIRSDNGSPFASTSAPLGLSKLSVWWVSNGICLDRIEKGKPYQNGSHERMHLEIARNVEGRVRGGIPEQQAALDAWRHEYNHERPHAALGMQCPADLYRPSVRKYDPTPVQLEYPNDYLRRLCAKDGSIRIHSNRIGISLALSGWDLGLQGIGNNTYNVWFGMLCLGTLDLMNLKFLPTGGRVYTPNKAEYAVSSN